ncbi:MAG: TonB family protein [Myxococcales bacterium]|nr:MAG: TonB family protein [Myxococcales bacterium]
MLRVSTRVALAALVCACQLTVAPSAHSQVISLPRPTQSPAALVAGPVASGATVSLLVTVSKSGTVLDATLVEPGDPALDAAALEVVSHWTFTPAMRDGEAIPARIRVLVPLLSRPDAVAPPPAPAAPPPTAAPPPRPPEVEREPEPALEHTDAPRPAAPQEVTVTGRHAPPPAGASDLRLDVGELARVPRKTATELLQLAPGIYLSNEGGEGHAERIYLRGFDAREGQDLELTVGGVPINESGNFHGNGFADAGFLIPELVHGLRVLEGPFDVRQGNYAVAGSADYETGLDQRGLTAKYTLGSYDTHRALALFAPEEGATYAGAELYQTAGFGQNRDVKRGRAMAQYEGKIGQTGSFRLSGAAYGVNYHSAGVLREDDLEAGRVGFFDTYDARQGGSGSRYHVSADLEQHSGSFHFGQQVFAIRRTMRLRENFTGFLLDKQEAIQSLHGQRGDLLDLAVDETTYGARGYAHTSLDAWGLKQDVELGYYARGDATNSQRQRVDSASIPYRTDVDLGANLGNLALYGEVTLRPVRRVSLKVGARSELFWFDVLDRCAVQGVSRPSPSDPPGDASCLDQQRFGQHREPTQRSSTASSKLLPRATLTFGPFDHFSYSLSYGMGVRSIDPAYVSQDIATPFASIRAADGGVAYARDLGSVSVAARSIFFMTHVDRDLVFSETEGRSVLASGTTRTGWNGLVRLRGHFFDQNANISLTKSRFDDTGLLVPYSPDLVVRSDSSLFGDLPLAPRGSAVRGTFSLGAGYVGHRALPYGQRSDTIFTLDTGASARWRAYELELQITNLLDSRYRSAELNYVSDFRSQPLPTLVPARHFAAGAPRMVFLSFSMNLGGVP